MDQATIDDLAEFQKDNKGSTDVIQKLVERWEEVKDRIKKGEDLMKELKEDLRRIETDLLPSAMIESNIEQISIGKYAVNVKDFVSANIPSQSSIDKEKDPNKRQDMEDKREAWFSFLHENGHGDLIKNEVKANFPKGSEEKVKEIMEILAEKQVVAVQQESVHPSTLRSFVTEQQQNPDVSFPDELGIFNGKQAVIKRKKA